MRTEAVRWVGPAVPGWVGPVVTATVGEVFTSGRSYSVRFGDCWAVGDYFGTPPAIGWTGPFRITRHVPGTRRILVEPA